MMMMMMIINKMMDRLHPEEGIITDKEVGRRISYNKLQKWFTWLQANLM